jgi:hypothetical protein
MSANVVSHRITSVAWGADPLTPSFTPTSAEAHAFLALEITVQGACTELLVDRAAGDLLLALRDVERFRAATDARLVFLDPDSGAFLGEAEGVTTVAPSVSRIALAAPLPFAAPGGALVCAISGGAAPVPTWQGATGARVSVSDASPFFVGEPVMVYEPQVAGTGAILDVLTVTGLDTTPGGEVVVLSGTPSAGHTVASLVVPLNSLGGEVALRPSVELSLQGDVLGGPEVALPVGAPAPVMVGDTILVDADGDLQTTADQAQATVKQVRFAPSGAGPSAIVVDLPASLLLLHGRARVIALGDAFRVGGTRDTSAAAPTALDPHADQFSPDGLLY